MNQVLRHLYDLLPGCMRSVPASLCGYYLRRWRYGVDTKRLVEESLQRDYWTHEKWTAWQAEQLARILHWAATRVPYYRAQWEARRRRGDTASPDQLENWSLLEKEPLRQDARDFLADNCNPRKMFLEHTSGTTGTPLGLWHSREMLRAWYALSEARTRRWYGVSMNDRWAVVGGQMVTPYRQKRPPFWVWNAAFKQLYLSSYHLAPHLMSHYLDALCRYRIVYLSGYPSSLHALAQEVLSTGRRDLQMRVVVTNAEPLYDHQRQAIAAAFQCSVRETYGMSELAAAASECEHGRLHLWPEVGIVEVLEHGKPVQDGSSGDIVVTGLLNSDMPLVRYCVGDRGLSPLPDTTCPCGRSLPVLRSVEGRTDDLLYTPDGRRVGRLDPVFKADLPIREAQIIQEALDHLRVRYVPATGFTARHGQRIVEYLRARMGKIVVVLEEVSEIPRTASGKFRAVICKLPASALDVDRRSEAIAHPRSRKTEKLS